MLITQALTWHPGHWPGPFVRVVRAETAAQIGQTDDKWLEFKVLNPAIRNVGLLQRIVVKLWAHRHLGFGPLLFCRDAIDDDTLQDLLQQVSDKPDLVILTADDTTGDIVRLAIGAAVVENPLFGNFFSKLTHADTMPPAFLADQLRRHLVAASDPEDFR